MQPDRRFIHGALSVEEDPAGGLTPLRFTPAQLEACYSVSEGRLLRALCAAGVTFEADTDARALTLRFELTATLRRQVSFALFVDGAHRGVLTLPLRSPGPIEARFALPGRPCRVQVYWHSLSRLTLLGAEAEGGSHCAPVPRREQLYLAFGDSITQGMEAFDPARPFPMQIARALNMELLNLGVGGGTFQPQLLDGFPGPRPGLITVLYGFNDRNLVPTRAQFEQNVGEFLARLVSRFPGVPAYVILPTLSGVETNADKFATLPEIRAIIREKTAAQPALTLIDGTSFMPFTETFFRDAAHPTDTGFDRMTRCLLAQIQPAT